MVSVSRKKIALRERYCVHAEHLHKEKKKSVVASPANSALLLTAIFVL